MFVPLLVLVISCIYIFAKYFEILKLSWKLGGPFAWPIVGNAINFMNIESK